MEDNFVYFLGFETLNIILCVHQIRVMKYRNSTAGTCMALYPKHYIMPDRYTRKIYGMKRKKIPKYMYYCMLSAYFTPLVPLVGVVISMTFFGGDELMGIILGYMLTVLHSFINLMIVSIFDSIYEHVKKKTEGR